MTFDAADQIGRNTFKIMMSEVDGLNHRKGWHDEGISRTFGDEIALLHSEVSEALEAYRQWGIDDATTGLAHAEAEQELNTLPKPEGVGSELADVLIRLLDTCACHDIDLYMEYRRKMDYNWTRPIRHGGKVL